jgi:predicted MFS family arabinose efflux permease
VIGFWVYRHGWAALCFEMAGLNLLMAIIAWALPDDRLEAARLDESAHADLPWPSSIGDFVREHVEWRVFRLSVTTALVSFGYGALTSFSALFADELGISPRSLFLSVMAVAVILGRLTVGRGLDSIGPRRVLLPCLLVPSLGLFVFSAASGRWTFALAALIFGAGFGLMQPSFTSYVLAHVAANRRGAAFGAMLAAFDTGIGSGASLFGVLTHNFGFRAAFAGAGLLAAFGLPYFLQAERRLGFLDESANRPAA